MKELRVIVEGDKACFTRPELKGERVSYDVPTPGALEGMLKSIYWKPAMCYVIDKIVVFNPITFMSVRRNEVKSKVSYKKMRKQMIESQKAYESDGIIIESDPRIYTNEGDERTQRSSLILRNVRYGIQFHIELTGLRNEREIKEGNCQRKHEEEFLRRCRKGQFFRHPCLGCAEFPANIELVDEFDLTEVCEENRGTRDLGFMLYKVVFLDKGHPLNDDWEGGIYSDQAESVFFRPIMEDGVIDIERDRGTTVC